MKISIIGWYNEQNCGDEAFKDAFDILFPNCEKIYHKPYKGFKLTNADYYVLGGGDVVKDFYIDNLPEDKEYYAIGVGLGYESEVELLKRRNFKKIYFRNVQDVNIGKKAGLNCALMPDLAFSLNSPLLEPSLNTLRFRQDKKHIAIVSLTDYINPSVANLKLKELAYGEYFKWELAESLDKLAYDFDYEIMFIAMSHRAYSIDHRIHYDVLSRMKYGSSSASVILQEFKPLEFLSLIKQANLMVSMKFHGLIFSTIANTPFINIGLSKKTETFCIENNLPYIKPFSFTIDNFFTAFKSKPNESLLKDIYLKNNEQIKQINFLENKNALFIRYI